MTVPTTKTIVSSTNGTTSTTNGGNNNTNKNNGNNNNTTTKTNASTTTAKPKREMASVSDALSFAFDCGIRMKVLFVIGFGSAILNGLVFPALAYLFSNSFSDLGSASEEGGLEKMRELAFKFVLIGVYALIFGIIQTYCFEIVSYHATQHLRLQWFQALLRQDPSFFDVNDIGGIAGLVGPSSNKYRRGMGRKFGEGIQFLTTAIGGLIYGVYASWRVALVVLAIVPFISVASIALVTLNQTKGTRAAESYKVAASVAYASVSSIKTVLSLNGVQEMIIRYTEATAIAYQSAIALLFKLGLANGMMLGSFLLLYFILTLYGTSLIYKDIETTGCDPTNAIPDNGACDSSAPDVFGSMLGIAFAAQGASQFGNFADAFGQARSAVYDALKVINRKVGAPEEVIYKKPNEDDIGSTIHSKKSSDVVTVVEEIRGILPKYEIDSSSDKGMKPTNIQGGVTFTNVHFAYPTRPYEPVLTDLSLEIQPGQIVAFVGPSGSGKSTVAGLLERFYDPKSGTVKLDGINLKDINVSYLRKHIGYVGQEPTLFATTIRGNILYGNANATQEQIEEVARMANAHDFIMSFPDGYDTQVGDKGSQLSGGQKQRIAICRCLIGNPKLLILDEATSALDFESEIVVQEALDNILQEKKITTVIIAHRLSTIRNADRIHVLVSGEIKESGTHDELMAQEDGYYRKLVLKQDVKDDGSGISSRNSSTGDLTNLDEEKKSTLDKTIGGGANQIVHLEFKDVTFRYPTRPNKTILDKFNLKIQKGQTVALCGPSGGGKSTTVGLLERFYDPVSGSLEYMGNDIKTLNVGWYREQIGYVGQEPTLFNDTIANNIAFGAKDVTRNDIIEAAKQANAYDFIMGFDMNFETPVGERGTQLSGGQKQRIAIARALVRKPQILLLDEATSALDNESEAIVQAAIDKLMQSVDQTVIVIAHRLSTIRNADMICFITEGKVLESGSHEELLKIHHGRYKRLHDSSKRDTAVNSNTLKSMDSKVAAEDDAEINWEEKVDEEEQQSIDAKRAREMIYPYLLYLFWGGIGSLLVGGIFPMWGLLFSEMIALLFQPVLACPDEFEKVPYNFDTCQEYWDERSDSMREKSYEVAGYWAALVAACLIGFTLNMMGFGIASEKLNKQVRDSSFSALLRQEVSYFDKRSVGRITSLLQDDAGRIHAFSGEPVRAMLVALASVVTGLTLSFIFMWQFALLAIGCIPIMGFATAADMKRFLGEDESGDNKAEGLNSPGGILVETLLNIRTVAALTLEKKRYADYEKALVHSEPNYRLDSFKFALTAGSVLFIQQGINGLQLWFGGWLLNRFPDEYELRDFLISNFAILFSLFGLGSAFQDLADRKEVEKSISRIFYLLDRKSEIDPLSEHGKLIA